MVGDLLLLQVLDCPQQGDVQARFIALVVMLPITALKPIATSLHPDLRDEYETIDRDDRCDEHNAKQASNPA